MATTTALLGPIQKSSTPPPSSRSGVKPSSGKRWSAIATLLKTTGSDWMDDEATRLAASLALYTLLSIAPLLVIAVAVAGMVFGAEAARGQISQQISSVVGSQAGQAIESLVANARTPSAGLISSGVGLAVLLFGASGVFGELQSALNRIWKGILRDRFFSFAMVMGVAFLLLVSLVVSAGLATFVEHFRNWIPVPGLWHVLNLAVTLGINAVLFALIFKLVPDVKVAWRDVWMAGLFTALAFSIGKVLLAWYVGRSATVSPFGAAGSLVALIVWVYYSAQILFLGAEFAQVYAAQRGSGFKPADNAVPLDAPEPSASS